jgi:putative phosphoesterase
VAGNNDGDELVAQFGRRKVVEFGGLRFGLVHGDQGPGATTPERAAGSFGPDEVDVVLFGHSHIPLVRRLVDGRWLVNPGSPTDKRRQPRYSFALMRVDAATRAVEPEICFFDDRTTGPPRTSRSR